MNLPGSVEPFYGPLESLQRLLKRFNERGVIIGGVAVLLLGKPRYTADVDAVFLIDLEEIPQFISAAETEGITPRIHAAEEFARKNRVLLLKHAGTETHLDILLGMLPFEREMVERSVVRTIGKLAIRLPTPEDLIITKALAHRPRDLDDIRGIIEKNPTLDIARIKQWVEQFAAALDMPDLWGDIQDLFK